MTRCLFFVALVAAAPAMAVASPAATPAADAAAPVPATPFGTIATPLPRQKVVDRLAFQLVALAEAKRAGLPYAMVDAVMKIESDYHPEVVGGVGEIGLMQVRPATAAMMGFRGNPGDLADPAVNIHYGASYLGQAWKLAKGNVCRTLMKYRAGHGEETMSALSVSYCARAKLHLASIGSPLADAITPADLVAVAIAAAPESGLRGPGGRRKTGKSFWAAFESRIGKINARLEAKWKRAGAPALRGASVGGRQPDG